MWVTFSYEHTSVGWPEKTYIPQLYTDTGCYPKDFPLGLMDGNRESRGSILPADQDDKDN